MDTVSTKPRRYRWLKVILWILGIIIAIPFFIVLLFQLSPVQNFAKTKVESFLRNKFHTSVMIGQLRLTWWNRLSIKKLYLGDTQDQALLYSGSLDVSFNLLKLINNQLVVKRIDWDRLLVNVYRLPGDTTYNYQFIMDAFASTEEKDTTTSSGPAMTFAIGDVTLTNCSIRFVDAPAGMEAALKLNKLQIKPNEIKPDVSLYNVEKVAIEGLRGIVNQRYIAQPLVAKKIEEEVEGSDTAVNPLFVKAELLDIKNSGVWYTNESSGLTTNVQLRDVTLKQAMFDPAKYSVNVDDIKIHQTTGGLAMQQGKDTVTTVVATDTTAGTAWIFKVKNLDVDKLAFKYDKLDILPATNASEMDFNHLNVSNIRVQAKNINYNADSILVNLNELTLRDKSGFAIEEGHADLLYTDKIVALKNLLIRTGKSRIASEVIAEAPALKTVSEDLNSLSVRAVLENTYINMSEIGQVVPSLKKNESLRPLLRKIINAEGEISGSMARLKIEELNITDNDGTKLFLTGIIQNAADPDRLIALIQRVDIQSGERSIKSWVPAGTIPDSITVPASIHLFGSANYSKNDVLTRLILNTSLGNVILNAKASNYLDKNRIRYDVAIPALRMDVGRLIMDTSIGIIDLALTAKGNGTDYKTLTTNVDLLVKEAFYNKYRFHDIKTVAALDKGDYNLFLESKDPNAEATIQLEGLLDSLQSNVAGFIDIQKLDLYATKLSANPMATKANMLVDFTNFSPRHLNGSLLLTGLQLADDSTIYAMDTLQVLASDTINQQQIALTGPFGSITANGDYDYTKAFTDIASMVQYHLTSPDSAKAFVPKETQQMDLNASLQWPNSLTRLAPGLAMEEPLVMTGRLNTDSSLFKVDFFLHQARYNDFNVDTLRGMINNDSSKLAAQLYLSRLLHPQFPLEKTTIDVVADNGVVDADIDLRDKDNREKYVMGALLKFLPENSMALSLKPQLLLNKIPWVVSDSNEVVMTDGALRSADLSISSRGQSIAVETVAKNTGGTPDLEVRLEQFRLSTVTALLEQDSLLADGVATGKATISNYDQSPLLNVNLKVDSIKVKNTSLGTLSLEASTPTPDQYVVKAQLNGNGNDLVVDGTYAKELDFNVRLNSLNMASIEPLTMGAVTRMTGVTSGQLTVKGTPDAPKINGKVDFDTVGGNITAIGNFLKLNKESLTIDGTGLKFSDFTIADSLNNKAVINGNVLTDDFKDYRFQLSLDADNFMVAGPQQSPDQMIYGPAFVDADAKIRGTLDAPRVDVNLTLRDSSKFTIVLPDSEPGIADREGVIVFVDRDTQLDSSLLRLASKADSLLRDGAGAGVTLNAQVEITSSSTLRVIVDQQNGDFLEVKGKANLDASMSPSSELSLTGRYEIDEGAYNMSLNNLIKRKFNIEKGSSITLQGAVDNALVDITARYRVEAVAGDLVEDQLTGASDTKRTQFKQRVPVDVYLQIRNELMKPEISFRLDMPERERNALNGVIYNRIKQINEVESELNKQVMGLLVLNSFIPENPLALVNDRGGGGVENTARKSVSKLISQQLNNFAGSLFKGFDVNFDLDSQEDYSTGTTQQSTNLNVGVSKSLFNDRISVSVGSSVNLEGPQQTQQASTLVGDVSVDYKITPDGRYRLRAYRQNETDAIVEGQIIETGASFIYVLDYDEFRELFGKPKKKDGKKESGKKGK